MSETVLLGLGANLGDALETLHAAIYALDDVDGLAVDEVSGVYRTPPWPPPDDPRSVTQEPFHNLAVRAVTSLEPHALLHETQLIEAAFGRDRASEVRWGPRPLDIDLLLFGERELDTPELTLPHPRIAGRAFVLVPLLEVAPGGALPDGRRFTTLLARLAPVEGIDLELRFTEVPTHHLPRPEGPSAPPASFTRPGREPAHGYGAPPDAEPPGT
ncbi:MAG: 2-amino-4-hydroxy-6-hydroxymethyldihydropteridine diphosphokinase, partial [Actinomycetota bacterium]